MVRGSSVVISIPFGTEEFIGDVESFVERRERGLWLQARTVLGRVERVADSSAAGAGRVYHNSTIPSQAPDPYHQA